LRKVYGDSRMEDARKELDGRTDIASDRKSGIITIRVSDHDAKRASAMAQEYVTGLNDIVVTLNTSSAHKERIFLEQRLAEVQQGLEHAEKEFSDFASQHTTIDIKEQGRAMIGAAADLEGELIATRTQLEGLRQIYTENNVRVRALQARVNELQRQLQKMGGKPESAGENGSSDTEDLYPSIRRLPVLGVQYADLYRRERIQEAVYETLTKQYELAKVEEARETPSVKVLDVGDVPERKSFPPRTLFAVLGMIFFFSVGCVWVLGNAKWQQIDPRHPGKMLAEEIVQTVRSSRTAGRASRAASAVVRQLRPHQGNPENGRGQKRDE
jgi:capsule polysaccharide export protein KpsE/RkpR